MTAIKLSDTPGRGRRLPRVQREAQMLEAASRLFAAQGFDATSMDEIAQACGVTKPMLYAYFGSKQGLYQAMIERAGGHVLSLLMSLQEERDPERRLRQGVALLIDFVSRHRESWRLVLDDERQGGRDIAGYRRHILVALALTLQQLRPDGVPEAAAEPVARAWAHVLLGAAESGAQWWLHTPGVGVEAVLTLADQVLSGLLPAARAALANPLPATSR